MLQARGACVGVYVAHMRLPDFKSKQLFALF